MTRNHHLKFDSITGF